MKFKEYIINSFKTKGYIHKSWLLKAITHANLEEKENNPYDYELFKDSKGYYCYVSGTRIDIEHKGTPFISKGDSIAVTPSDIPNLEKSGTEPVHSLIANQLLIVHSFGDRIPYMGKDISFKKVESAIYDLLVDKGTAKKGTNEIGVEDYLLFHKEIVPAVAFYNIYISVTGTEGNTSPPAGLKAYKAKLIKEYGKSIKDPIVQVEFEKKIKAYIIEKIKDDPSYGKFLKGKTLNLFIKQYGTFGSSGSFDGLTDPIIESLAEGLPTNAKSVAQQNSAVRYGSFGRGKLTQTGGVFSSTIAYVVNHLKKVEDCKSTKGMKILLSTNPERFRGYYKIVGGKTKPVEESDLVIGKMLELRLPTYCKAPAGSACSVCLGKGIGDSNKSIGGTIQSDMSAVLKHSLRKFHSTELASTVVKLDNFFS